MGFLSFLCTAVLTVSATAAYDDKCGGVSSPDLGPRMQPDSHNATNGPWRGLSWGEINFIHTTDIHGWLEGHLNEVDYGADLGDFVSFVKRMRDRAHQLNVDLLTIDTGDHVTGNGLSDATHVPGRVSNNLFENVDYDLLTIGNNDLYSIDGAKDIHANFSRIYGDRFLTSNVEIKIEDKFVPIGQRYRHFTTEHGLRIVAFGFTLLNFKYDKTGIRVSSSAEVINQQWFMEAMKIKDVDLYVLIGHADVRENCHNLDSDQKPYENPFVCMEEYIRKHGQPVPIQAFGGHTHRRDFKCYDTRSSALESGRYADTVGWLALGHVAPMGTWNGSRTLPSFMTPTRTCTPASTKTPTSTMNSVAIEETKTPRIDRRYLDFNRRTFAYHAVGAPGPDFPPSFDTPLGRKVSDDIWKARHDLNLTTYLGCAPRTYYLWTCPAGMPGNIYHMVKDALTRTVKKENSTTPRIIIMNNGTLRYDLYQGPFTVGDAYTIVPYDDKFQYIPNVPYEKAKHVVTDLNNSTKTCRRRTGDTIVPDMDDDSIISGWRAATNLLGFLSQQKPLARHAFAPNEPNPGHVTIDDFGDCTTSPNSTDCGDDTIHTLTKEDIPNDKYFQAGDQIVDTSTVVDLVFTSHVAKEILNLDVMCHDYNMSSVADYMDTSFTTRDFLQVYAQIAWKKDESECQIGA